MIVLAPYGSLIDELVDEARSDPDVDAVLLTGSLARGDAHRGADLDLRYILREGVQRAFRSEWRRGVHVEISHQDEASASREIENTPMNVYAYLDGRALYDPKSSIDRLHRHADERFDTYRCPEPSKARSAYWLRSAHEKMTSASTAGDTLKAVYVATTAAWPIIEGLWAAGDRPLPPNSSVRPHLGDLRIAPPDLPEKFERLFLGDPDVRVQTAVELIEWIVARLSASAPRTD